MVLLVVAFVGVVEVGVGLGLEEGLLREDGGEGGGAGAGAGGVERGRVVRKVRCVRTSWLVRIADWVSRICVEWGGESVSGHGSGVGGWGMGMTDFHLFGVFSLVCVCVDVLRGFERLRDRDVDG